MRIVGLKSVRIREKAPPTDWRPDFRFIEYEYGTIEWADSQPQVDPRGEEVARSIRGRITLTGLVGGTSGVARSRQGR